MASTAGAVNRINYIITGTGFRASPSTITGGEDAVYSYRLRIAYRYGGAWHIHPRTSTRPTNRHIGAMQWWLHDDGYRRSGMTDDGYERWVKEDA